MFNRREVTLAVEMRNWEEEEDLDLQEEVQEERLAVLSLSG